ncbi:TetR/AcrR family transcriptional regulator [Nocardia gamkensis]|uniref:TetR/AcrR family transcriptional regulator n=1 Tax=Nocardia gamkensis TaxID=352869 RepID=UPI0036EB5EEB
MARLTRKEMHARTRERLLETAQRLFLSDGYNATSMEKVAAEAGYSKGAVYSNFATRYELGLAVLDRVRHERADSLISAITSVTGLQDRLAAFDRWAERTLGDEGWTVLEVEFAASSRHIEGIPEQLADRRQAMTAILGAALARQAEQLGVRLTISAEDLAVRLLAMGIGLGVQRAFDPHLPVHALSDLVREAIRDREPSADPAATKPTGTRPTPGMTSTR